MKLVSEGREYRVELRSSTQGTGVLVDGAFLALDVAPISPGTFVARREGVVETFHCVRDGRTIHLFWRGSTYRLEEADEDGAPGHRPFSGDLEAPMPGKVIAVQVAVGDRVAKGDEVLVVEAMKMENGVRAPKGGIVKALRVKVGDIVARGMVLAEIE